MSLPWIGVGPRPTLDAANKATSTNGGTCVQTLQNRLAAGRPGSDRRRRHRAVDGRRPGQASPYHEPPWLIQRGKPITLAYALLDRSDKGTLYVRNSLQESYTRLSLTRGAYCPGDPVDAAAMRRDRVYGDALVAHVRPSWPPARSSSITPSCGSHFRKVGDRPGGWSGETTASLDRRPLPGGVAGSSPVRALRAPDAIVARAGPNEVGLCAARIRRADGPSSFDIAPDGSMWVLDRLNHRLLVWRAGQPARPARSVKLPRNLNVSDFALGRNGMIFIRAGDTANLGKGNKDHLYALTATGR